MRYAVRLIVKVPITGAAHLHAVSLPSRSVMQTVPSMMPHMPSVLPPTIVSAPTPTEMILSAMACD